MTTAIHWFRRDFRLADNTALNAALAAHDQVIPVYILSTWEREHRWTGPPRQEFLCGCLDVLAQNLATRGGRLIIRQGVADEELEKLLRESGATAIYFNRDPDPFGRAMEVKIAGMAERAGASVHACQDIALHEREEILTASGKPYRVFTPYARAWHLREKPQPGRTVAQISTPSGIASLPLPKLATWKLTSDAEIITPGETAARQRLDRLLEKIAGSYGEQRNFPADDSTSRISQDLRHGLLSIREVYQRLTQAAAETGAAQRKGFETFVNELVWREFYMQVLWFRPDVLEQEYQPETRGLPWAQRDDLLEAWKAGRTGFPIVMRACVSSAPRASSTTACG
jgi:deoxyribodipyrimidine photo-lyase